LKLSIIIPTFNEKKQISNCIASFGNCCNVEIIVSDSPNSLDNIKNTVEQLGVTYFKAKQGGRNFQMNEAAAIAKGDVLYFVHADTIVTKSFYADIQKAIAEGFEMGCYRYKFDQYKNPLLYINSFFTRFPMLWCRGGDQTLFVKKPFLTNWVVSVRITTSWKIMIF
jgi:glycosyltransferase involved in cell wall biosynthesis